MIYRSLRSVHVHRQVIRPRLCLVRNNRMNNDVLNNQRGFTLAEMLVAIMLMMIGIFAVIGTQSVSMNASTISLKYSVATSLAQEVLEDILSWKSDNPVFARPNIAIPPANYTNWRQYANFVTIQGNSVTVQGAGTYTATYTTKVGPDIGIPEGVTQITVTITDSSGKTVKVTGFKRTV